MEENGDHGDELATGLYDTLIDEALAARIDALDVRRLRARLDDTDAAELPDRIAEVVGDWVRRSVASIPASQRHDEAFELTTRLLELLSDTGQPDAIEDERLDPGLQRLRAIEPVDPSHKPLPIEQPLTPLRDTVLLTNARDESAVGHEIAAEIASADAIDVVLAFIRWTGVRDLLEPLRRHVEAGKALRVVTTTYTGSTELRALQALADLGAEIRVSYDVAATRLHAKAWCFHRDSGFSTVYIGSSNLTFSA